MKKINKSVYLPVAAVLLVVVGWFLYDYFAPLPVLINLKEEGKATPFEFSMRNQYNKVITQDDLKGHISVLNFFYATCPTICPAMNSQLKRVYEKYKGDNFVKFYSFTVDPEHDSVAVLREYAEGFGVNNNQWNFLTGNKARIYTLAIDHFQLYTFDKTVTRDFVHSEQLVLIDPELRVRGFYKGTEPEEVDKLIEDIKKLKKEYE